MISYLDTLCFIIIVIVLAIIIQSLLRGRFLRNSGPTEDERRSSVAARELGQLRQHHPVSGLRYFFLFIIVTVSCFTHTDSSTMFLLHLDS